jgi:LPS O-antigen subunit length determinant protein (WzzB/FepE family)
MLFGNEMDTSQWLWLLWKGKYRILSCAFAAAIVGVFIATTLPKVYETNLVVRPAGQAAFVPFSDLLSVTPGNWHSTGNIIATAKQSFLGFARDRDYLRAYVLSHQDLMPKAKLDDPDVLQKIVYERFDVIVSKDTSDDSFQFRFRYGTGTSGAQFLNGFVKMTIDKTIESLNANGRSTLAATKKSKENELERLREMRDIGAKQLILKYQEALDAAKSASIEKPVIVNSETTSPLVVASGQTPLFLFGTQVLATELKNIEARKGNDLAIPEFSSIASSMADISRRLNALDQTLGAPIVITQLAYETRPVFPPKTPIILICVAIGAALGGCWEYLRTQKPATKSQV